MILSLVARNIRVFLRDRASVFFSLLASLMMFLLYIFFLGNLQIESVQDQFPGASRNAVEFFINSWVFAGILTLTPITTSLAALQVFVADNASGRFKDFTVAPIARWKIILGYLGGTFIIAISMSLLVFLVSELYLVATGGSWLSGQAALHVFGLLALLSAVFAAFASFIATLVKSESAFSSVNIVIGTAAGFLTGVYVPIGVLPSGVASVMSALPFYQSAALMREPFAGQAVAQVANDQPQALATVKDIFGFNTTLGDYTFSTPLIIAMLLALSLIFVVLATWRISRRL